ncbi:aminoglycoside phosphotransferase family protein [Isoptericola sp. 4D.3]|uniref:Aminoglycoside phosphotransferase family protein n=1 Tax=Isoptericola peretonis TaxID=2918523 RepID=A0ABT0J6X4_9MICO|nr:aminoglycoside phosphotransferase family protein [Isoptericola sp. 4D.3]
MTSTLPHIDVHLVRGLVESQFPQWSRLPLALLDPAGSDHVIYRLGEHLTVRLPRHGGAVDQARKEMALLPRMAPLLPLAVPEPVAVGEPGLGYPWDWGVTRWLEGAPATVAALGASTEAAQVLAEFLLALQALPHDGEPAAEPLVARDAQTRAAIDTVGEHFDSDAMIRLWEAALAAPAWDRPPVWFHGDFHTGNLLTVAGRVTAVLDFGELGTGDPARDLMMAFTLLSEGCRPVFRQVLGCDDATWLRGRGWALTTGLSAYTAYARTRPDVAAQTRRQILAALEG